RTPCAKWRDLRRRVHAPQAGPPRTTRSPRPAGRPHRARRGLAVDRGVRPLPPGPQGAAEARHQSSSLRPGDDPPRSVRDRPRAPRGRSEPAQRIAHASTPASMKAGLGLGWTSDVLIANLETRRVVGAPVRAADQRGVALWPELGCDAEADCAV